MIQVENLRFTYPRGAQEVLKGISFDVSQGEVFGFLGPSGAGKSTLQKILLGLHKTYTGTVNVMGQEIRKVKKEYYNDIGVGFELPNLYEQLTILENLKSFASLYKNPADIAILLKEVGLYEHRNQKVSDISKGMKMRLNFCRAQIGNPSILFLDEPTSGLDPNNTKVIQDKILGFKEKGYTVILTTHNMTFAEDICDKVAFVVEGQIKELAPPADLRRKYGKAEVQVVTPSSEKRFPLEGLNQNNDFRAILEEEIVSIDTLKPTLQEIFTIVTGRVLV
jgi:fluoroquinolone transport system ATP-binding protein